MRILFFVIISCILSASPIGAFTVTDQAGREVEVPAKSERVLSLAPSITEIVYSLDAGNLLVGATQYSDYPEAAKALPRVGSYVRLDLERVVSLQPDLCIGIRDGNPKHLVDKIEGMGIPVYVIDPRNLGGIMEAISGIGTVLGVEDNAALLLKGMQNRISKVQEQVGAASGQPRVFFQVDAAPIITAGTETFTHELITLAGGVNLGAGKVPYPRLSWEQALAKRPEVVVITSMAGGHSPESLKKQWQRWQHLPAVKAGRIHVVDANLFDRPTARLVQGLELLLTIIHPELTGND